MTPTPSAAIPARSVAGMAPEPSSRMARAKARAAASQAVSAGQGPVRWDRPEPRALGRAAIRAGRVARDRRLAARIALRATPGPTENKAQIATQRAENANKRARTP